ncbi:MAG: hypothetical protein QW828_07635, partial [Candidatus Bathyarchaeia archaeon]
MKRTITYFETPGFANTALVIEAVKERLTLGDVGTVLVPATTGRTAQQFQHALGNAEVIAISEDEVLEVRTDGVYHHIHQPAGGSQKQNEGANRYRHPDVDKAEVLDAPL